MYRLEPLKHASSGAWPHMPVNMRLPRAIGNSGLALRAQALGYSHRSRVGVSTTLTAVSQPKSS